MDDLIERIENARSDADYWANKGDHERAVIALSLADCAELGSFLTSVFGALLMGRRDSEKADRIAILASAFEGEGDD